MERPRIRFQLDEHVSHAIAQALRQRGIDVVTAAESGTASMPDDQLLARCLAEERVLVTNDKHFLGLNEQGAPHAGIDFSEHGARSIGELVAFLTLVVEVLSPKEMTNRVEFA